MLDTEILEASKHTTRDIVEGIIAEQRIVDYGVVKAVNSDGTVDVTHLCNMVMVNDDVVGPIVSKHVELLTTSTKELCVDPTVVVGDRVLLLSTKDHFDTVDHTSPVTPDLFLHYTQENIKAVPLFLVSSDAKVKVTAKDGKLTVDMQDVLVLKNTVQNLRTLLDDLFSALGTINTTGTQAAQTINPTWVTGTLTPLQTRFQALFKAT